MTPPHKGGLQQAQSLEQQGPQQRRLLSGPAQAAAQAAATRPQPPCHQCRPQHEGQGRETQAHVRGQGSVAAAATLVASALAARKARKHPQLWRLEMNKVYERSTLLCPRACKQLATQYELRVTWVKQNSWGASQTAQQVTALATEARHHSKLQAPAPR